MFPGLRLPLPMRAFLALVVLLAFLDSVLSANLKCQKCFDNNCDKPRDVECGGDKEKFVCLTYIMGGKPLEKTCSEKKDGDKLNACVEDKRDKSLKCVCNDKDLCNSRFNGGSFLKPTMSWAKLVLLIVVPTVAFIILCNGV